MGGTNRSATATAFVLILFASGCIGGGTSGGIVGEGTDDPISSRVVEAEPGIFVAENRGAVRGVVLNEAGLKVSGAYCLLVGADAAATTGVDGLFQFLNVSAGTYTLRVEHGSFQVFETPVEVRLGNVTNVTVNLVPRENAGAGYRPHLHDYWGAATEFVLMDRDHDLTTHPNGRGSTAQHDYTVTAATLKPNRNASNDQADWWFVPIVGNEPSIVLPGTGQVQIVLTWSAPSVQIAKMGVAYRTAFDNSIRFSAPRASGEAHTILVNASESDAGHQRFSLWNLWLFAGQDVQGNPTAWTPQTVLPGGSVHIVMTLIKSELVLEPPHVDYWKGSDTLLLRNHSEKLREQGICCTRRDGRYGMTPDTIVPPGTHKLIVDFRYDYEAQDGSPADYDYTLTWRTGDMNPQTTRITEFARATPKTNDPGHKVWELDVTPQQTDAFYQRRSNWLFTPWAQPWPEDGIPLETRTRILSLEITAIRDPAYADE